jgi:hypothetical protein
MVRRRWPDPIHPKGQKALHRLYGFLPSTLTFPKRIQAAPRPGAGCPTGVSLPTSGSHLPFASESEWEEKALLDLFCNRATALSRHRRSRPLDGVKRQNESGESTNEIHFVPGSYCGCCTCRDMTATLVFLFSFSSIYPLAPSINPCH